MSIQDDAGNYGIELNDQWSEDMEQKYINEKLNDDAEFPKKASPKKASPKKASPKKAKQPEKAKPNEVINNISGVRFKVYGQIVQPGGSYEPKASDLKDVKGGERIDNAVKKGYLKRG